MLRRNVDGETGYVHLRWCERVQDAHDDVHQIRAAPSDVPSQVAPAGDADPKTVGDFGTFSFGGKTINFGALELRSGENVIHLTLMESELLRHLVQNDGKVVSRKQILEEVWGLHEDTDTRAIDNFVVRLRRYIEVDPVKPRHLLTVRGVGYRFLAQPAF